MSIAAGFFLAINLLICAITVVPHRYPVLQRCRADFFFKYFGKMRLVAKNVFFVDFFNCQSRKSKREFGEVDSFIQNILGDRAAGQFFELFAQRCSDVYKRQTLQR